MRVITAPGVEIKEIDKSQYSPAMTGTNCYIMGFANKGEPYQPMEFTTRAAWVSYYGEPDNEAEKYFYNACVEVLNQNGRLYCARLPYDNTVLNKMVGYTYIVNPMKALSSYEYTFPEITAVDPTVDKTCLIQGFEKPSLYDLSAIDEYRTDESKVPEGTFLIVDKTCSTYKKIPEDQRKGQDRELVGIIPVVTTAANALYAQKLINVEDWNAKYYEVIGNVQTLNAENAGISGGDIEEPLSDMNRSLVTQLNSTYKNYKAILSGLENEYETLGEIRDQIYAIVDKYSGTTVLNTLKDTDADTAANLVIKHNGLLETLSGRWLEHSILSAKAADLIYLSADVDDTVGVFRDKFEDLDADYNAMAVMQPADRDDQLPDTVSFQANEYFSTIEFDSQLSIFKRDNLKDIGVVVFKSYIDAAEGNKIAFEPVEAFCGSLFKDDKDMNTGTTKFIDTIINSSSNYINFFSNCFNTKTKKNLYLTELDMLVATPTANAGSLGFYEYQTVEKISVPTSIYDGMNKCFEKVSDINERDIDIVCDAGVSNIASFIKKIYDDQPGYYDLNMLIDDITPVISQWKCNSNDAGVKTWKSIVQKFDSFCKNDRKDCMFITECPRPLVLTGLKKIIRPSKPANTIDANILPYVKFVTGLNTNYGAGYMDWFEIADEYTGDFIWLPPSIKAMGVYINTDVNFNYWDAPAGLNRGVIAATDVSFSPNAKQAGSIYEKNWNYAINYPQDGIVLEGQKTFQVKPSAFDRVNVRRLFLRLERMAYKVARYFVYEGNTAYTRQRLVDALDPYFKEAKVGGGIYDYKIICDESTNPPETIDRNELKVKIGIKPVKTAEFILIDFIALTTGGSFEEAMA